jgi:sugar lactone lactonase YvrE
MDGVVLVIALVVFSGVRCPLHAEIGDLVADQAVGQSSVTDATALPIGPGGFGRPVGLAIDRSVTPNRVYVTDGMYHRVLGWSDADALTNGAPADLVIGQPDFTTTGCNHKPYNNSIPGAPTMESLCAPAGLAVDGAGSLYVADAENCRILVFFDPFGTDTVADLVLGQSGVCDGVVVNASKLYDPQAVAVDGAGNVFVADTLNCRVLEYDGPLTSTDLMPDRVFGQADFTKSICSLSTLYFPRSLALDASGNLFVGSPPQVYEFNRPLTTDTQLDHVLGTNQCNPSGESASSTCGPNAVAADDVGRLYVGDAGNNRVLEFDNPLAVNQAARVFGQPGFTGSSTLIDDECNTGGPSATSLCFRKTFPLTLGYSYDEALALAIDGSGRLYVADGLNNRVLRFDTPLTDAVADLVLGQTAMNDVRFPVVPVSAPQVGIFDNSYALIVVDSANSRLQLYGNLSKSQTVPGAIIGQPDLDTTGCNSTGLSASSLCQPTAAIVDPNGNLWVADTGNNRVLVYNYPWFSYDNQAHQYVARTAANRVFGQPDFTAGNTCSGGTTGLCGPRGIAVDSNATVYISDSGNNRIVHHINPLADSIGDRVYGQSDFNGTQCNAGGVSADSLCDPRSLAINAEGDLFVTDRGNNRVLVYDQVLPNAGGADHVFGQDGSMTSTACASGDGGLCHPGGLALDRGGNLLVADTDNNRVTEYNAPFTGTKADRIIGQPDTTTNTCNTGGVSGTSLCQPADVAAAVFGEAVFVADAGNNRVLRYDAPYCIGDFRLDATTRKLKGIRSTPKGTKVRVTNGLDPAIDDDILSVGGRLTLLERDGHVSGSDEPLLTLSTANGIVYQERVPYMHNTLFGNTSEVWQTEYLKGERDRGIDDFHLASHFLIPANDLLPQRDRISYHGRAVGLDLSSFTEAQATFRLQFDSICFTTDLTCRNTGKGRKCRPAR